MKFQYYYLPRECIYLNHYRIHFISILVSVLISVRIPAPSVKTTPLINGLTKNETEREREWMKCIIHIFTRIVLQIIEERTTKEACEIYLWVEIHLEFINEKTMKWGTFYCRFNYAAKSKSRANISTQNWNEQSNNRTFNKKWTEIFIISNFCWMALANFPSKARNCTIFMKMNICVELFKKKKQCSMHALMLICHDANDEMCKSVWL